MFNIDLLHTSFYIETFGYDSILYYVFGVVSIFVMFFAIGHLSDAEYSKRKTISLLLLSLVPGLFFVASSKAIPINQTVEEYYNYRILGSNDKKDKIIEFVGKSGGKKGVEYIYNVDNYSDDSVALSDKKKGKTITLSKDELGEKLFNEIISK